MVPSVYREAIPPGSEPSRKIAFSVIGFSTLALQAAFANINIAKDSPYTQYVRRHENNPTRCSMSSRTASCSCGQLRIQVEGEPRGVGICHCLACQQRTGSVFAALASFSAPFKVFGTATEYIRVGDQGAKFIFRFCPVCGTTVFHTEDGHNESVGVAVGAFADPNFPAPRVSVYDSRRHPWVQLPPGTRTFDKDPSQTPQDK
jgi:hypothetical protein